MEHCVTMSPSNWIYLPTKVEIVAFADDIAVVGRHREADVLPEDHEETLETLRTWLGHARL